MKKILAAIFVLFSVIANSHALTAGDYFFEANAYYENRDYENALVCYRRALELFRETGDENLSGTAASYSGIGLVYMHKGDYDRALEYLERSLDIYKNLTGEEHPATAVLCKNIADVYRAKGDFELALEYYVRALNIQRKILEDNNSEDIAGLCFEIASVYCSKEDFVNAIDFFYRALEVLKVIYGETNQYVANVYYEIGKAYRSIRDYDASIGCLAKAVMIYNEIFPEKHPTMASIYTDMGFSYLGKKDYSREIDCYNMALAIRKDTLGLWNSATADTYTNLAYAYFEIGDYDKSLECHINELEINRKVLGEVNQTTAMNYNDVGFLYYSKGDYNKALEYYDRVLNIHKELFGEEDKASAATYNNIGLAYKYKGDYSSALKYYRKYLNLVEADRNSDTITAYINLGSLLRDFGDANMGLEYTLKALDLSKKVYGERDIHTAWAYNNIGLCYSCLGDYDKVLMYHQQALDIYKSTPGLEEHPVTAAFYQNIGFAYLHKRDLKSAVSSWKDARKVMLKSSDYSTTIGILKQMLFSGIPDTAFLRETLVQTTDTVERARLDMSSMKDNLLKESLSVYYFGVGFESRDGNPGKAFEYSEALRSRGFLDQMGTEAALRLDGVTDSERRQVQNLASRISAARAELERQGSLTKQERDEARYKKAGDELSKAEKELALLDEEIGGRVPAYAQLRNPQPVSVKQAQDWCGKKRAVLEYVLWSPDSAGGADTKNTDIGSYCIVLTQKEVSTVRLDGDFDYTACINKLRKKLSKTGRKLAESRFAEERNKLSGRELEQQFEQERDELYARLIAPVLPKLSGIEELVIVPDGSLSLLPFDILRPDADSGCLGDKFAISFSPSVSVSVIADTHKERTESVLAFGGAWYDKNLSDAEHRRKLRSSGTRGVSRGADRGLLATDFSLTADNDAQLASMRSHIREYGPGDYFARLTWQDLPGTVAELDRLREYVFTSVRYDERMQKQASEAELKRLSSSGKLRDYSVLHLACHGYFDKNISDMSSVLFSEVSGKLKGRSLDDGYLTIPETAVLSLDADMVCLSACETGLGELRRGDGMVGLSRAFMVAGADRVGVSLWCIDDDATVEFMEMMYQKVWQEGKSYSRAYREVKAEFRKSEDFCHPYYWAAFVLYE